MAQLMRISELDKSRKPVEKISFLPPILKSDRAPFFSDGTPTDSPGGERSRGVILLKRLN